MDTNLVLNTSFDELVFEKRNKNYGAYQMRKRYRKSVLLSALLASGIFVSAMASFFLTIPDAHATMPKDNGPVLVSVPVTLENQKKKPDEPVKPQKPKPISVPPAKGSAPNTTPEITNKPVDTKPQNDTIGNPNGIAGGSGTKLDTTAKPCTNCQDTTTTKPPVHIVIDIASDPPTFKGDIDIFFQKNIKYPQMAKEAGIEGTVWLSWVVNTKGEIENVEVIKGANPALDREALRAAKLMPAWNPGKDNGELVNFRYRKPIRFMLAK